MTPYVEVDVTVAHVVVPDEYVKDGKIILNISSDAVAKLDLSNHAVEFDAGFSGKLHQIYIPMKAVLSLYAVENGRGMFFDAEDEEDDDDGGGDPPPKRRPKGPPNLKVVK